MEINDTAILRKTSTKHDEHELRWGLRILFDVNDAEGQWPEPVPAGAQASGGVPPVQTDDVPPQMAMPALTAALPGLVYQEW